MKRLLLYVVVLGVILLIVKATAPLVALGVIGLVILAWRRPETVGRFTERPGLARLPAWLRATPMRFAGSVAASAFVLIGISAPIGAASAAPAPTPTPTPQPQAAEAVRTASPSPSPTAAQTAKPTIRQTPSPEPTPIFGTEPTGPTEVGTVVKVTDGDTIKVDIGGTVFSVRYIGIDTPEIFSGVEWMGPEAAAANAKLLAGHEVVLEKDVSETDQYHRLLRYVWIHDGASWLLVNLELIKQGYAQVSTYPPDVKYTEALYLSAEQEARSAGRGLWGATPAPAPTAPPPPPLAPAPVVTPAPPPPPPAPTAAPAGCHPSYQGACLGVGIGDYDCAGGSGNGPNYVSGPILVVGPDEFGLDGDGDGIGCE